MSSGAGRHDLTVARFEGFLEANPEQPLHLTEICAAIGVTDRTLRNAWTSIWEWGRSAISPCAEAEPSRGGNSIWSHRRRSERQ
jgi:hypothetical protein